MFNPYFAVASDGVLARPADGFVDSICVNTHWDYLDTAYNTRYEDLRAKLLQSGIRYDRGLLPLDPLILGRMQELGRQGIRHIVLSDGGTGHQVSPDLWSNAPHLPIAEAIKRLGVDITAGVEGPNELDISTDRWKWHPSDTSNLSKDPQSPLYWAKFLPMYMKGLYDSVKSDPVTAKVPVYGPSLTSPEATAALGSVGQWVDASNVHWYIAERPPETSGWGANGYGSLAWTKQYMSGPQAPGKPVVATEGGYASSPTTTGVTKLPEDIEALYMPRLLLTAYAGGIEKFCKYQLIDYYPESKASSELSWGLLRLDLSEKPAFTAIKNLIKIMSDPGKPFRPAELHYSLTGATAETKQQLYQKRDGSFWLAVWQAGESWEPNRYVREAVKTANLQLSLSTSSTVQMYRPNDGVDPIDSRSNVTSYGITSGPAVTLVRIAADRSNATSNPLPVTGDLDGDEKVGIKDLSILLAG